MSATTLVPVEEYLSTVYDPDMDYVDGELEDRNIGDKDHAKLQLKLVKLLDAIGNWFVTIETRIRISTTRYRVPDICVYPQEPREQIFVAAPVLVIEVLSSEDRMSRMQRKLEDYHRMGCASVWILDHERRKAYQYDGVAIRHVDDNLTLSNPTVTLGVSQIFPLEDCKMTT